MTKSELIGLVANRTDISKVNVEKVLTEIIDTVISSLKNDPRFPLYGLGVFEVVKRPKRKGRNPRTGEPITIKARKMVRFRASKSFKDAVNTGGK
ncbi:MAG: HU family DNA-binding protein [Deltaproteobacteria bacterium]|jgi:DNA-binding protein HU-beta|nr:HU family DNA-binding protein [Deltaproteobacteria bacterium]